MVTAVDTLRSLGATATLNGIVRNARHEALPDVAVSSWTSSNPAIVTVNTTTGLVAAVVNGAATITAHAGAATGSTTVTVLQSLVSATLAPPTDTLRSLGATGQYTVVAKDAGGAAIVSPVMNWRSTNSAVVTVGSQGLATAVSNGSAYVVAQSGIVVDSLPLAVLQRADPTKSTITVSRPLLFVADTVRATLRARDALDHPLTFGGSTVVFSSSGGTSTGAFGPTVDQGDGTYTSDFVGSSLGTTRSVGAMIGAVAVSTAAPPLRVVGFTRIGAYSAGFAHTCGIITTGDLYCWGSQLGGMRGLGSSGITVSDPTPTLVIGGHQWTEVDAGFATVCGIAEGGKLYCWGGASEAALGNGVTTGNYPTPVAISPESSFVSVDIGLTFGACAITPGHTGMCWGKGTWGRLGNGAETIATRPVAVSGGTRFAGIATSYGGTCGVTDAGAAMCWGIYSVLGTGGPYPDDCGGVECSKSPVAVSGGLTFKPTIVHDGNRVCAIATNDKTYCWGGSTTPTALAGAPIFTALAEGDLDACGLAQSGTVYCWGSNRNGRFGSPPDIGMIQTVPVPVPGGQIFTKLSMSQNHMCGITTDGNVWCWGSNDYGELGDRTTAPSATPVRAKLFAP
jgi:alpha-tubulin suppressor-like RCC1 family protein